MSTSDSVHKRPFQTIRFEVDVDVYDGAPLDQDDIRHVEQQLQKAVDKLRWRGVEASVDRI